MITYLFLLHCSWPIPQANLPKPWPLCLLGNINQMMGGLRSYSSPPFVTIPSLAIFKSNYYKVWVACVGGVIPCFESVMLDLSRWSKAQGKVS